MADHERLDRAIDARRLDLGLSWVQLAATAGISDVSLRNFRKGRGTPNALSKRRLEAALQWAAGSVDELLAGGQPIALGEVAVGEGDALSAQEIRRRIAELRDEIKWLSPRYERNRPMLVAHLEQKVAELERQLDALHNGDTES